MLKNIVKPIFSKSPDSEVESTIPWPKIEGSLPIQSPTSVAPKEIGRERSNSVFAPPIIEYKTR